ncbi:LADA_0B09274g1_1 [Lachancea dasiensis]|uniref:tRNA (guanine(9)-N1)-methyltransferase n=1 Tax=Lachancea dasiensis TaxID=1072105 RepID=A0A1G4IUV2_9SACH|nr:LADA_0B09274g1_1 [Lachancea dasiensis]
MSSESEDGTVNAEETKFPLRKTHPHPLPPVPEGMSKSQWKKVWKKKRWEDSKEQYALVRREKRNRAKLARRAKIQEYKDRGEEIPEELRRPPRKNMNQTDSGIQIIIDCAFDDLMNDKEITSLSNQITRAYSFNRREDHYARVRVTSFDKRLKERFERDLEDSRYSEWKNFEFTKDPQLPLQNAVYLTADTDEVLERLEPGTTYIVGGIVDKNRHKLLCYNKARELGIPTRKLPLAQYINLTGREVLTSTHVVQLMLRYFKNHDWKEAFEAVLPPRKLEDSSRSTPDAVETFQNPEDAESASAIEAVSPATDD